MGVFKRFFGGGKVDFCGPNAPDDVRAIAKNLALPDKREKLAAQLTWLANRHILGLPEDRRHERIELSNPRSTLKLPNGTSVTCRITDVSLSGAAIESETVPAVGALVTRPRGAWCGTSRAASPSSSRACSTRTSWKRT